MIPPAAVPAAMAMSTTRAWRLDGLGHQDRFQDIPFELIDDDDDEYDKCRVEWSVADKGDQRCDSARRPGADDRDVKASRNVRIASGIASGTCRRRGR